MGAAHFLQPGQYLQRTVRKGVTMSVQLILSASVFLTLAAAACGTAARADTLSLGSTSISLGSSTIDFFSSAGAGTVDVSATSTGAFAGLGGTRATLTDVSLGSVPVSGFISIPSMPQASFSLTTLDPGLFSAAGCSATPPAPGQTCSLSASPYSFVNTPTGSIASFTAKGTVTDTATGATTPFTATFSTEFTTAYQEVLSTIGTAGIAHASFSASVNVASGALAGTLNIGQPSLALTSPTIASSPATAIGPTSTGAFAALVGKDVTLPSLPFAAGPVSDVFTVAGLPDVRFTLTNVDSGLLGAADCTSPPAAGEGCTPTGTSLNLLDTGEGFDLWLSAEGTAFDSATLDTTPFDAIFSAELDGMSYQALLATIGSGGTVDLPYSVELAAGPFGATSPVPEPTTPALLGAGILASLAFGGFRQPRRRVTRSAETRA